MNETDHNTFAKPAGVSTIFKLSLTNELNWKVSLNKNQENEPSEPDGEQLYWGRFIWLAIHDAISEPLDEEMIHKYTQDLKLIGTRGKKNRGRYLTAKRALDAEETRQSGIDFIMGNTFLGVYKYAFQASGEWLQEQLVDIIRKVEKTPSSSGYWRGVFNGRDG